MLPDTNLYYGSFFLYVFFKYHVLFLGRKCIILVKIF